jgi:hypothetical protein
LLILYTDFTEPKRFRVHKEGFVEFLEKTIGEPGKWLVQTLAGPFPPLCEEHIVDK